MESDSPDDTLLEDGPGLEVELDWEAYFKDFCNAHGKYPVVAGDLLLFPDGWRYSSTDHAGPEYPPPTDPDRLNQLLRSYWLRRYDIVRREYRRVDALYSSLRNLQSGKSVTLKQRVSFRDDDGQVRTSAEPVNLTLLEKRIEWLNTDVDTCLSKLKELMPEV